MEGSSKEPGSTYRARAQRSGAPKRNRANINDMQANSLLLRPHGMAQFDYDYEHEHEHDELSKPEWEWWGGILPRKTLDGPAEHIRKATVGTSVERGPYAPS